MLFNRAELMSFEEWAMGLGRNTGRKQLSKLSIRALTVTVGQGTAHVRSAIFGGLMRPA